MLPNRPLPVPTPEPPRPGDGAFGVVFFDDYDGLQRTFQSGYITIHSGGWVGISDKPTSQGGLTNVYPQRDVKRIEIAGRS